MSKKFKIEIINLLEPSKKRVKLRHHAHRKFTYRVKANMAKDNVILATM